MFVENKEIKKGSDESQSMKVLNNAVLLPVKVDTKYYKRYFLFVLFSLHAQE